MGYIDIIKFSNEGCKLVFNYQKKFINHSFFTYKNNAKQIMFASEAVQFMEYRSSPQPGKAVEIISDKRKLTKLNPQHVF
jgi:hypothetical protein